MNSHSSPSPFKPGLAYDGPRRVTLLRHGATTLPGRYHGRSDVPLSGRGMQAMHQALGDMVFDRIVSSPLQRCVSFAQDFAAMHDLPLDLDADWMELDFGEWEGKSAVEILEKNPKGLKAFWRDPIAHPPPQGETLGKASERVLSAWKRLPAAPSTLIVTHSGAMRLLFCRLMGLPMSALWQLELNHAARMDFIIDESGERLHYFHAGGG